jgi:hypothetical protein
VRETVAGWFARVEDEASDADAALLLLLANLGLRFLGMFDLLPLNASRTRRLRKRLLEFAEQEA